MAYFSNNTEAEPFMNQCSECVFGNEPCPIALAQFLYNYESANNQTATDILNTLVKDDGTCNMLKQFPKHLKIKE